VRHCKRVPTGNWTRKIAWLPQSSRDSQDSSTLSQWDNKSWYKKILKVQNRQTGPSWLQQAPRHSQFHSSQELQICICSASAASVIWLHMRHFQTCFTVSSFRTVFRWRTRVIQQTLRLAFWLVCSYCRHSISLGWSLSMLAIPCDTRVCKSLVPKQRLSLV